MLGDRITISWFKDLRRAREKGDYRGGRHLQSYTCTLDLGLPRLGLYALLFFHLLFFCLCVEFNKRVSIGKSSQIFVFNFR